MRKIYLKLLIGIIVILWLIYLIQWYNTQVEQFTPKINGLYRPYVRNMNQKYETFVSNYGPQVIINKFKKMGIY
jgi:hypothetical protein